VLIRYEAVATPNGSIDESGSAEVHSRGPDRPLPSGHRLRLPHAVTHLSGIRAAVPSPWGASSTKVRTLVPPERHDVEVRMVTSYVWLSTQLSRFSNDRRGQGLAEYALILALIAIVAILALIFLGGQVSKILSTVGKSI
jgi:Flp pilus assembly pilin Flp